jgi:two-component system response regulator YesN
MSLLNSTQVSFTDQRDFWDTLQMDILTANQNPAIEDFKAYSERSFMFSLFFRGCTAMEIVGFQKALQLKDNGYLVLLELSTLSKNSLVNYSIDEFALHRFIRKTLQGKSCAIGPVLTNRMSVLICEDSIMPDEIHMEVSTNLCLELIQAVEYQFKIKVTASIGSMHSIHSIYTSFTDALSCLYYNNAEPVVHYSSLKRIDPNNHIDYLVTQKHLVEAVRLRKVESYDYFGLLMDDIRTFSDTAKRNKILEILVLAKNAMSLDSQSDVKQIDYVGYVTQLMNYTGNELIDFGYQLFIYITSYVKPQNSIDYSNHIVKATKEYLELNYAEDISLEDMAEHVNISPQYFSKLIKKTTGFNFIDWLSMLRVKKAKELLNNSNLTVKEVCFMVGYKDPNYFSRIFKKRIGITPSEYVKANSFLNNKN